MSQGLLKRAISKIQGRKAKNKASADKALGKSKKPTKDMTEAEKRQKEIDDEIRRKRAARAKKAKAKAAPQL